MQRRRKRYGRAPPPDLWADLGPGDPGYRWRPGASGLDPLESYQEGARVLGILLSAAIRGRLGPFPLISLFVLFGLLQVFMPWVTEGIAVATMRAYFWGEVLLVTAGAFIGLVIWVAIAKFVRL